MKKIMPIKRTKEELYESLKEQKKLLQIDCKEYDSGEEIAAKHISVTLRVLFHDSNISHSLLKAIGIRDKTWIDSSHGLHQDNMIAECSLMTMRITNGIGGAYVPKCLTEYDLSEYRYRLFVDWWNMPIVLDNNKKIFNRRQMVEFVANTDSGAHVDEELEKDYKDLTKKNYFEWEYIQNGISTPFTGKVELICMRQIAFEVLTTLQEKYSL